MDGEEVPQPRRGPGPVPGEAPGAPADDGDERVRARRIAATSAISPLNVSPSAAISQ